MMLQALMEYAERKNLGDADFQSVDVRWEISLLADGSFSGLVQLFFDPSAKKPRPKSFIRPFTSVNELAQGKTSHFLCDTLEREVLFLDPKAPEKAASRKIQHEYFMSLLEEAAAAIPEEAPRLQAVLAFLKNDQAMESLRAQLTGVKAKPSDNGVFTVDSVNLLNAAPLKAFWRKRRAAQTATKPGSKRICIATGELAETLDTTEKIKGVPGGLSMGTNLISFDKSSFCSFGLEQAQNAALSAPAELKIRSALNELIEKSKTQKVVFNDVAYLHWPREEIANDPVAIINGADPEAVEGLLHSVEEGARRLGMEDPEKANKYYLMSISGNGARIVVRDWLELTVPEVERNVAQWFQDLAIVSQQDGETLKRNFRFGALLYGMVRAELKDLAPQIPTQLFHAALSGGPLPMSAFAAALRRQQVEFRKPEDTFDPKLNPARMAFIKAFLRRSPNQISTDIMTEKLDPECTNSAYLCGRLFAVFDRLQYLALGGVNAGVVERFYASASTTPSLVMGRLFKNAQFHLAKAGGGIAENVRKDFEALSCALGCEFPSSLSLEDQGRFALGYYHQKAEYRKASIERKESQNA